MVEALSRNKIVFSTNVSGVSDLETVTSNLAVFSTGAEFIAKVKEFNCCSTNIDQSLLNNMFDPINHVKISKAISRNMKINLKNIRKYGTDLLVHGVGLMSENRRL